MTPAQLLMGLWAKINEGCPDIKFQIVPFKNTPENAREILGNFGNHIDVIGGIFAETMLDLRSCAGLELSRESFCCAVSIRRSSVRPLRPKRGGIALTESQEASALAGVGALADFIQEACPWPPVLEHGLRRLRRGRVPGHRGLADHAPPGTEHGVHDEELPAGLGTVRTADKGSAHLHQLSQMIEQKTPIHDIVIMNGCFCCTDMISVRFTRTACPRSPAK